MQFSNLIKKPKTKLGANSVRDGLTNSSPMLIILCFICCLVLLGIIKFNYQTVLFNVVDPTVSFWVALLFSIVVQVGRMAFGFVGVRDLARGKWVIGILGICASIAITVFEHTEVTRMVEHWKEEHLRIPLLFLVWGAFLFELRLIMTMIGTDESEKEYDKQVKKAQEAEERRFQEEKNRLVKYYHLEFEMKTKELKLQFKQQRMDDMESKLREKEQALKERENKFRKNKVNPVEGNGQPNSKNQKYDMNGA